MKKLKCVLFTTPVLFIFLQSFAQAPQSFNYQAVCRDSVGNILANQMVDLRFSIFDITPGGNVLYKENQSTNTNSLGLANVAVGTGSWIEGNFLSIPWDAGAKYLGVELNTGSGYASVGAPQLMSVPYAIYANQSGSGATGPTGPQGVQGVPGPTGATGSSSSSAILRVGVGANTDVDWLNFQFPFNASAVNDVYGIWMNNVANPASASYFNLSPGNFVTNNSAYFGALLPDFDAANNQYTFASAKQAIFQIGIKSENAGQNNFQAGVGFEAFGAGNWRSSQGSNTIPGVGFVRKADNGQWFTRTCDAIGHTEKPITISDAKHTLRCEYDPAHATPQVRFYVDGILVDTIDTHLPTGLSAPVGFCGGNGSFSAGSIGIVAITCPSFAVQY
jgi:hypothetical protein